MNASTLERTTTLHQYAIELAAAGYPVFPRHPRTKIPATENGFYDATTDINQINRWWEENPDYNIGIPTGNASGLVVIDRECSTALDGVMKRYAEPVSRIPAHLPFDTPKALTGRGGGADHIYLKYEEGIDYPKQLAPEVDVLADGQSVTVPPSIHPNGNEYSWLSGKSLLEVEPAPIDAWLRDAFEQASKNKNRTARVDMGALIPEGTRNNTLTSIAGKYRRDGMGYEIIHTMLYAINENQCKPPLPTDEVDRIAESVSRYEVGELPTNATNATNANLKEFPVEVLPASIKDFVIEASKELGCPVEMVGLPALVVMPSAVGSAMKLRVKGNWIASTTLYGAVIGSPGSSKSPAAGMASIPLLEKQGELKAEYVDALDEYECEASNAAAYDMDKPEEPKMARVMVEDTTVEALIPVLEHDPYGVMVKRDELSGWLRSMDQYKANGKGSDRQQYLSLWSNEPVSINRKKDSESTFLTNTFISLFGTIQPDVLPDLRTNRNDGMFDRFLIAYPEPHVQEFSWATVSPEIIERYKLLYERLYALRDRGVVELMLTPEAKTLFKDCMDEMTGEMKTPGFPSYLEGPFSKLKGYLPRLSLLLALLRYADSVENGVGDVGSVGKEDVESAYELIKYFIGQAAKVHGLLRKHSPEDQLTKGVTAFLKEHDGSWVGSATDLLQLLTECGTGGLPGSSKWLSPRLKEIADSSESLEVSRGWRGDDRVLRLRLSDSQV